MKKTNGSTVTADEIESFRPITKSQEKVFKYWEEGHNLILNGSAGTGKTFLALYLALKALYETTDFQRIVIVRSIVPTRDVGFLPGDHKDKLAEYLAPYKGLCDEIFGYHGAFHKLVSQKKLHFESTSYLRGMTFDYSLIIVDEMQNLNFHELDSVMTRLGKGCRIVFAGDYYQSDFNKQFEKQGINKFLAIIEQMRFFRIVNFGWEDIVRSDFVRDYIMTKEMLDMQGE